jgi:hypothetical protein
MTYVRPRGRLRAPSPFSLLGTLNRGEPFALPTLPWQAALARDRSLSPLIAVCTGTSSPSPRLARRTGTWVFVGGRPRGRFFNHRVLNVRPKFSLSPLPVQRTSPPRKKLRAEKFLSRAVVKRERHGQHGVKRGSRLASPSLPPLRRPVAGQLLLLADHEIDVTKYPLKLVRRLRDLAKRFLV